MVPCQRRDWWANEVRASCARFGRLPREVFDRIVEMVEGWPIGMAEGEAIRREFTEESEGYQERHTAAMKVLSEWDFRSDELQ